MFRMRPALILLLLASLTLVGCDKSKEISLAKAKEHVEALAKAATQDVAEVKNGLPAGAKYLVPLYQKEQKPADDLSAVREALDRARGKVQDLRVAKSTFFALVADDGTVLRNDQEQDRMAGKNAFKAFPELKQALSGKYLETRGSMLEAAGVNGPDGQWIAAAPVVVDGKTRGLYVSGWSWSSYAYRLETAARGQAKSEVMNAGSKKEPLLYVYVVVDDAAYGAPVSPEVNAKAILAEKPLEHAQGDAVFAKTVDITGRDFGLAVKRVPALGKDVAIAVLRSET